MTVIGIEAANSYVKVKGPNGEIVYPNVKRIVGYGEENLLGSDNTPIYRIGSNNYIVGDRKFDFISSSSRESDRYSSSDFKTESLIAIAKSLGQSGNVTLVTGLPSSHYRDGRVRQSVVNSLRGAHKVYVNDEARYIVVEKVHVILQPFAALISVLCDEFGNIRLDELTQTTNVVVDIGWGTTDVAILDGSKLIAHIPVSYSMYNAYKRIEEQIRRDFPQTSSLTFTPLELEDQLRDGNTFKKSGDNYDVSEIKETAFKIAAGEIMRSIKNEVQLAEYDHVFFAGGGVSALSEYLSEQMESSNARKISEPQMAIVRGLYNYGVIKR